MTYVSEHVLFIFPWGCFCKWNLAGSDIKGNSKSYTYRHWIKEYSNNEKHQDKQDKTNDIPLVVSPDYITKWFPGGGEPTEWSCGATVNM